MEERNSLRLAFNALSTNNKTIDINMVIAELDKVKYEKKNKTLYDIITNIVSKNNKFTFNQFVNYIYKKFCYLSSRLPSKNESLKEYETFEDLNAITKYNFLCDEYNNGNVLDLSALIRIKNDIENRFNTDAIDEMINVLKSENSNILSYDIFKKIIS
jgi:hypothetical protein